MFFAETIDDLDDETPEVPDSIPRHGDPRKGYPKIRRLDDPTKFAWYQRASKLGKPIESAYLLDRAERRQIVYGMSRRDDLVAAAEAVSDLAMVRSADLPADVDKFQKAEIAQAKRELERIADEAIKAAGGGQAAAKGTAFHKLREQRDRGDDLSFLGPKRMAALDAWSLIADRFTWHGSEQFVVADKWQAAGTYDALWSPRWPMTAPDGGRILPGERLIVDLKSGAWGADMWGAGYLAQLAVYANGVPYVHVDDEAAEAGDPGRRLWGHGTTDTWTAPRKDWALIPHVPVDSPDDAGLVWVDLRIGARMAEHAATIMADRQAARDGFAPAELPEPPAELTEDQVYLLNLIQQVLSDYGLEQLWQQNQAIWTDEHTAAVRARLAELSNGSTEVRTS